MKTGNERTTVEGIVYREFRAQAANINEEDRTVELTFSSEHPVMRRSWFDEPWVEVLSHEDGDVDLSRLNNGASLLYNHGFAFGGDDPPRLGRVMSAEIKDQRGHAVVRFSKREAVDGTWQDVRDEILVNVSVGYQIDERVLVREGADGEPNEYLVRWTPLEISIVDTPADPSIGIGRSQPGVGDFCEGTPPHLLQPGREHSAFQYRVLNLPGSSGASKETVTMKGQRAQTPPDTNGDVSVDSTQQVDEAGIRAKAVEDYKRNQATRRKGVNDIFDMHDGHDELRLQCIQDEECTPDDAGRRLLEAIAKRDNASASGAQHVQLQRDEVDGFTRAAYLAIAERAPGYLKLGEKDRPQESELRGFSLLELARRSLVLGGHSGSGGKMDVVGRAFVTSGAFTNLLADVANKSLLVGWSENEETWQLWTRPGNLSDFKIAKRVALSQFSDLIEIPEGAEYSHGVLEDFGETIQLASYGRLYNISRQAIINDDLDALTRIPMKMGRAAARLPGDLAYAVLTANGAMSDGTALFHADHSNLGTAGAISVTTVGQLRTLLAQQTDPNGETVSTRLKYVLTPLELEDGANVLRLSEYDPASTTNSRAPNPVRNGFEVVSDHRLSAASTSTYYGTGDPQTADTVEVAFLDGVQTPRMEQQAGWNVDGTEFKVGLDVGASALDWRSMVRNTTS